MKEAAIYKLKQPEIRRPIPIFAVIAISILFLGAITLVVLVGRKQPDSSTHSGSIEFVQVTQEVTLNQDIVIGVNNATLYIPKEATTTPGIISITPREPNLFSNAAEQGWVRSPVVNVEYWNGQGTPYPQVTFETPVQICFRITDSLWEAYALRPEEFQIHYYAENLNPPQWQPLPLVPYPDRLQLCGETDHLSIFALAIKRQTVIPSTGATPTLVQPYAP